MWSHFHHEADIGVRGIGRTPEEAFEEAALVLTAVITDPGNVTAVADAADKAGLARKVARLMPVVCIKD